MKLLSNFCSLLPRSGTVNWEDQHNSIWQREDYSQRFRLSQKGKLVASAGQQSICSVVALLMFRLLQEEEEGTAL